MNEESAYITGLYSWVMHMANAAIVESLLTSTHRIIRIAATRTGSTVLSAVWSTLSILSTEGPQRIGDLAKVARISQPGMTKIVNQLVADEWVLRIADVDDSRAWLIAVTEKGGRALAEWRSQLTDATADLFADLSPQQWATLAEAERLLSDRVARAAVAA
jgi:DNA-binding MarR family transcriptional regulator